MRVNRILRRYSSEIKLVGIFTVIALLFAIYNLVNTSLAAQNKGTTLSSNTYNDKIQQLPTYTPYPTLVVPTMVQINIYINNTSPIYNEFTTNAILQTLSGYPIPSNATNPNITTNPTNTPIPSFTNIPTSSPTPMNTIIPTSMPLVSTFTGKYFNNSNLNGTPILIRTDNEINFEWKRSSPHVDINIDYFSVKWEGIINSAGGKYQITTKHDDGMRVFINNTLVYNQWSNQPSVERSIDVNLNTGNVPIVVEYYETNWDATAQFSLRKL